MLGAATMAFQELNAFALGARAAARGVLAFLVTLFILLLI